MRKVSSLFVRNVFKTGGFETAGKVVMGKQEGQVIKKEIEINYVPRSHLAGVEKKQKFVGKRERASSRSGRAGGKTSKYKRS